jgi:hypothetical protein
VTTATPSYEGHRYPVEIINHCVWLYFRFPLSGLARNFGDVFELWSGGQCGVGVVVGGDALE